MALRLYNTASREVEEFSPINAGNVTMYNCGPTVYNYMHIGNLRAFLLPDILRRFLEVSGYEVRQIMNITDVGHLVSDTDEGEDKIEAGAKREGKTVEEIIAEYSEAFFADIRSFNLLPAEKYPRASMHIPEQIALIKKLEEGGYTYRTGDGIYFDTTKFPRYADFARLNISGMRGGDRVRLGEKRSITDFALWKFFSVPGEKREQEWESPWGKGFPGWHIECSAMSMKYLGETLDIHTGGVDHIPVHHTNEIAQSECATGKPFARYWLHTAFMNVNGEKMSKSLGNTFTLRDLHERGIPPLAFRYWLLTAHYRTQLNFTWEALAGAQSAYNRLTNYVLEHKWKGGTPSDLYQENFLRAISDDLNTGAGIALLWDLTKDPRISDADKCATILLFDRILGIGLAEFSKKELYEAIPEEVLRLSRERAEARAKKDWTQSDRLREEIGRHGYSVKDTSLGSTLEPQR